MTWVLPVPVEVFQPRSVRLSPLVTGVPQFGHIPPEFRGHSPVFRACCRIPLPVFPTRSMWSRLVATMAQPLPKLHRMVILVQDRRCHALSGPHIMMRIPLMRHART